MGMFDQFHKVPETGYGSLQTCQEPCA
ncbi:hypothetical protein M8C21_020061 [Ambrosia artemisiifolia]|uniref:Uncharacterized protein n=1 Tax=Ambrosia artemisiifolia TaxID=4212 RepID=A0AAD5BSS1_AMBAR|nr:hypothetical protein M8C21_020061 [Ambrosia artemisiifolia]